MNLPKNRSIQRPREHSGECQAEGVERGMSWEFGVSRRKPLHAEWTNDKVLLYSTANYIQSPGINCDRKEHLKESVYIYVCV